MRVHLSSIVIDAGTQVRAALSQSVVAEYAEHMSTGVVFPPVVVYCDNAYRYVLADGFHRVLAAQRLALEEIEAEVHAGTVQDALWYALGANRAHGFQLAKSDKDHAVRLALRAWPERLQRDIAVQVGCAETFVAKVYGRISGGHPRGIRGFALQQQQRREEIAALVAEGKQSQEVKQITGASTSVIARVRREMGKAGWTPKHPREATAVPELKPNSRAAVTARRDRMRALAAEGYSRRQIARAVGMTVESVAEVARTIGLEIHADSVMGKTKRHDPNRIVDRMSFDAEHLCADVNLIEFADLDLARIPAWLTALERSRDQLGAFIRRLQKVRRHHENIAS